MKTQRLSRLVSMTFLVIVNLNQGFAQKIAAGSNHSLSLCHNGTARSWGYNLYGQLGDGSTGTSSSSPVQVATGTAVKAIAAGSSFSLALLTNGTVWAWGDNT